MDETSGSGAPIYRHEQSADPTYSGGDPELIEAVAGHVAQHLGDPANVWHQVVSPYVHVDVHVVDPSPDRDFYTLVTSGMAEKPMATPDELAEHAYAELVMALPKDWDLDRDTWPLTTLQSLASMPHEYETWFGESHTVPNGDPPEPWGRGTKLCGAIFAPPLLVPDDFRTLTVGERTVRFLAVVPLYAEEMDLKLAKGAEVLFDLLDAAEVNEWLGPRRESVAGRKKRRGLFRRR
jgi:hypothetical protein